MEWITRYFTEFWQLTAEMAPYLILGFAIAGLLRVWLSPAWVEKHLGQRSTWQNIKASLIGVPIPLCSCGIIPVSAAIRKQGGSRGAVASFTASTPQTGVDSILATWAMLGPLFTGIRVVAAFFSGWLAGGLVNRFEPGGAYVPRGPASDKSEKKSEGSCCSGSAPKDAQMSCCASEAGSDTSAPEGFFSRLRSGLKFGLITLPADIARSLILGIGLGALITTVVPADYFGGMNIPVWLTYFAVMLFAVPLYVCSTGSIPMAFALVQAGLSPGTALVFLIAGPATNTATLVALFDIIGKRATALYLAGILITGIAAGFILDQLGGQLTGSGAHYHELEPSIWMHISGILLVAMLVIPAILSWVRGRTPTAVAPASCCGGGNDRADARSSGRPRAAASALSPDTTAAGNLGFKPSADAPNAAPLQFSGVTLQPAQKKRCCCSEKENATEEK